MIEPKAAQLDPYDAVLADLRAKREAIDAAIATLESLRDGRLGIAAPAWQSTFPTKTVEPGDDAGMFLGMSISDAAKKLLKLRMRALSNAEIMKELQAGGLVLSSNEPQNVIGSVLTRRFGNVGDIVRVDRGVWGLKEWYPGRTFKPGVKATTTPAAEADIGAAPDLSSGVEGT